ncbi:hypothetical protein AMAG_11208 [Allomyces macrogynus ATCC 38327]|uniref:Uncharacterized protein n=1 Tax=Allomyces macrogynus (strain ATCC 38327) TaxID=578462 RepID=A0A0L0SWI9_ALLM3|nr:hypothetical protein AMAG_11208 [Allomyces macrogynus ATCC 38327]|eukprot:KNE66709.1 hypothetical protein AMAG_11208 [Allomyces macrogynus ATCC 38327]
MTVDGAPPRIGSRAGVHVFSGSDVTIRASLPADLFVPETFMILPLAGWDNEDATALTVVNTTSKPIFVHVAPSSNPNDPEDEYVRIVLGYKASWKRPVPQMVLVKDEHGVRDAVLTKPGSKIIVVGSEPLVTSRSAKRAGNWFVLPPGACDVLARPGQDWEGVLVRTSDQARTVGACVPIGTHVKVRNFDRGQTEPAFEIEPAPVKFTNST